MKKDKNRQNGLSNSFLDKIQELDDTSVKTERNFVFTKEFKEKTGIYQTRMSRIVESEGKEAKIEEIEKIIQYYSSKLGKKVSFNDLFPVSQ